MENLYVKLVAVATDIIAKTNDNQFASEIIYKWLVDEFNMKPDDAEDTTNAVMFYAKHNHLTCQK